MMGRACGRAQQGRVGLSKGLSRGGISRAKSREDKIVRVVTQERIGREENEDSSKDKLTRLNSGRANILKTPQLRRVRELP
jgi:hypothetical protein